MLHVPRRRRQLRVPWRRGGPQLPARLVEPMHLRCDARHGWSHGSQTWGALYPRGTTFSFQATHSAQSVRLDILTGVGAAATRTEVLVVLRAVCGDATWGILIGFELGGRAFFKIASRIRRQIYTRGGWGWRASLRETSLGQTGVAAAAAAATNGHCSCTWSRTATTP